MEGTDGIVGGVGSGPPVLIALSRSAWYFLRSLPNCSNWALDRWAFSRACSTCARTCSARAWASSAKILRNTLVADCVAKSCDPSR